MRGGYSYPMMDRANPEYEADRPHQVLAGQLTVIDQTAKGSSELGHARGLRAA